MVAKYGYLENNIFKAKKAASKHGAAFPHGK